MTMNHYSNNNSRILSQVASELERMRCLPAHQDGMEFPAAARHVLYSLPGNNTCIDCGAAHPQWASVSFGTLLCLQCSGHHRGLGVQTSRVRSIEMDTWSHTQVLAMLEGGNVQLQQFLERHRMGNAQLASLPQRRQRYATKAARFYRVHLAQHAKDVAQAGLYQGREVARQKHSRPSSPAAAQQPSREQPQPPSIAVAQ